MQLNKFDIFPTEIISFEFNNEEIQPLIEEINKNKKKIKQTSYFYNNPGGVGKYYTDYKNPTKLHEYEKLMMMIGNYFINNKKLLMSNIIGALFILKILFMKHIIM